MLYTKPIKTIGLTFLMALIILSCGIKNSATKVEPQDHWRFKMQKDTTWLPAQVPGTVHTDLLANNKIPDPFYRLNELDLQWIDKENWEYETNFYIRSKDLNFEHLELQFAGLDTHASVFLNNALILRSDNMFRTYSVDVRDQLKEGINTLRVVFDSPIRKGIEAYDKQGYVIPVSNNDFAKLGQVEGEKTVSIYSRKAGYHFGWDWGPRLVTSGIWRAVKLVRWNNFRVNDVFIRQQSLSANNAQLTAEIDIEANKDIDMAQVGIYVNGKLLKADRISLQPGTQKKIISFNIDNPKIWWPNGYGSQPLYHIDVLVKAKKYKHKVSKRIGLRTIELVREPDAVGASFYFKVNGVPIFAKGVNYIPNDVFLPRVDFEQYRTSLEAAKDAHMNMIRVWGGGIYENDEFYDLCDEMGLLVWQDFMFACAMFPGHRDFLENVKQEAIDNVKRLRNHPSIALWCGNNEILIGWENWDWKSMTIKNHSLKVANEIKNAYDTIFHDILPEVVNTYDGTRAYWSSSPSSDTGELPSMTKGDEHIWLNWPRLPFETYNEKIPRFASEYGFQSFPDSTSVSKYALPEDYSLNSDVIQLHQRSVIGIPVIEDYIPREFKKPEHFSDYIYISQLLQAHGNKVAIEAHRRNKPYCMGTLYWQLNDCWPVASWSSIDYYGKWKALHYSVKRLFSPYMISITNDNNLFKAYVVSDILTDTSANLELTLVDFDGNTIKTWNTPVTVKANASEMLFELLDMDIPKERNNVVLRASLKQGDQLLAEQNYYFVRYKDLALVKPEITVDIAVLENTMSFTVKTNQFAKDVFLSLGGSENFSDNYFDLLPGETRTVTLPKGSYTDEASVKKDLKVMSLRDTY